jgi:predicted  nucleic acid-binding Zn-ribbon protein
VSEQEPNPTTTEPRGLRDLLRLQEVDLALDRLRARQSVLEGGEQVAQARARSSEREAQVGTIRLQIDEVAHDQRRLEHDIDAMGQKRRDEEKRLYDGSVANARELQSIRAEVDNIASRTTRMEDRLLEVMEQREALDGQLQEAEALAGADLAALQELTAGSASELADIERALEERLSARVAIVPLIDPDLVALYEDLRRQKKGVGVAELRDGVCLGCHQKLSPMELDRIRREPGVKRCESCRRILVLT